MKPNWDVLVCAIMHSRKAMGLFGTVIQLIPFYYNYVYKRQEPRVPKGFFSGSEEVWF